MPDMTPRERLLTALRGGVPDRVPCFPSIIRWLRYHRGCTCPRHQLKLAEGFGFDLIANYGQYVWQSVSDDYVYAPGGGYGYSPLGLYGDLPDVNVELRIENREKHVWYHRSFHTPAGDLSDVIQWARPNVGYGDGPNPHRVEPLVKTQADLEALRHLYPEPRRDLVADIPIVLDEIGTRAAVAAVDCTHAGSWGLEPLGPEGMLIASITDVELLRGVCRLAQDAHLRNLKAMLEQGIQVVYDSWFQCGPSVGWSPNTYQEIFLPLIKEAVDLAHEFGAIYIYQDDGKMRDIIPLVVQAGVDVLGPGLYFRHGHSRRRAGGSAASHNRRWCRRGLCPRHGRSRVARDAGRKPTDRCTGCPRLWCLWARYSPAECGLGRTLPKPWRTSRQGVREGGSKCHQAKSPRNPGGLAMKSWSTSRRCWIPALALRRQAA
jgi:hypothetical protein